MAQQALKMPISLYVENLQQVVDDIRSKMNNLRPGTKGFRELERTLERTEDILNSLYNQGQKPIINGKQFTNVERDLEQVEKRMEQLGRTTSRITFSDLKLNPAQEAQIKAFEKTIENLKQSIKNAKEEARDSFLQTDLGKEWTKIDPVASTRSLSLMTKKISSEVEKQNKALKDAEKQLNDFQTKANASDQLQRALKSSDPLSQLLNPQQLNQYFENNGNLKSGQEPFFEKWLRETFDVSDSTIAEVMALGADKIRKEFANTKSKIYKELSDKVDPTLKAEVAKAEANVAEQKQMVTRVQNILTGVRQASSEATKNSGQFQNDIKNTEAELHEFENTCVDAARSALEIGKSSKRTSEELGKMRHEIAAVNTKWIEQERIRTTFDNIKTAIVNFMGFNQVLNLTQRAVRNALNHIKELDTVMSKISIVTDMSTSDLWQQVDAYSSMAQKYGTSIKGTYEVSQIYYQQGLQTNDVLLLTNETLKLAKISGLDYATTTDYMTTALRGFKIEAQDASRVVDVYSNLASHTAVSQEELAIAMSKTASSMAGVGASFEEASAMIGTMVAVTRESATNIGSAMKSIASRYGELTKDPTKLVDEDGEAMAFNKVDAALQSVGISMRTVDGQFRNFTDVIIELGEKWDQLESTQQRYIATQFAGNRQQSRFLALVSNIDLLKSNLNYAEDSEDTGTLQALKALDSIEAKTEQVKVAYQQMYTTIGGETIWKGFLDSTKNVINTLNGLPKLFGKIPVGAAVMVWDFVTVIKNIAFKALGGLSSLWDNLLPEDLPNRASDLAKQVGKKFSEGMNEAIEEEEPGAKVVNKTAEQAKEQTQDQNAPAGEKKTTEVAVEPAKEVGVAEVEKTETMAVAGQTFSSSMEQATGSIAQIAEKTEEISENLTEAAFILSDISENTEVKAETKIETPVVAAESEIKESESKPAPVPIKAGELDLTETKTSAKSKLEEFSEWVKENFYLEPFTFDESEVTEETAVDVIKERLLETLNIEPELLAKMREIGSNVCEAFLASMLSNVSNIKGQANEIARAVIEGIKEPLDINSPSKVIMALLNNGVGEAVQISLKSSAEIAKKAAEEIGAYIPEGLQEALDNAEEINLSDYLIRSSSQNLIREIIEQQLGQSIDDANKLHSQIVDAMLSQPLDNISGLEQQYESKNQEITDLKNLIARINNLEYEGISANYLVAAHGFDPLNLSGMTKWGGVFPSPSVAIRSKDDKVWDWAQSTIFLHQEEVDPKTGHSKVYPQDAYTPVIKYGSKTLEEAHEGLALQPEVDFNFKDNIDFSRYLRDATHLFDLSQVQKIVQMGVNAPFKQGPKGDAIRTTDTHNNDILLQKETLLSDLLSYYVAKGKFTALDKDYSDNIVLSGAETSGKGALAEALYKTIDMMRLNMSEGTVLDSKAVTALIQNNLYDSFKDKANIEVPTHFSDAAASGIVQESKSFIEWLMNNPNSDWAEAKYQGDLKFSQIAGYQVPFSARKDDLEAAFNAGLDPKRTYFYNPAPMDRGPLNGESIYKYMVNNVPGIAFNPQTGALKTGEPGEVFEASRLENTLSSLNIDTSSVDLSGMMDKINQILESNIGQVFANSIKASFSSLGEFLNGYNVESLLEQFTIQLRSFFPELRVEGTEGAKQIIAGLAIGLNDNIAQAITAGQNGGRAVIDALNKGAGVASPSVFAIQSGKFIMLGLAEGMSEETKTAIEAAEKAGKIITVIYDDIAASTVEGAEAIKQQFIAKIGTLGEDVGKEVKESYDQAAKGINTETVKNAIDEFKVSNQAEIQGQTARPIPISDRLRDTLTTAPFPYGPLAGQEAANIIHQVFRLGFNESKVGDIGNRLFDAIQRSIDSGEIDLYEFFRQIEQSMREGPNSETIYGETSINHAMSNGYFAFTRDLSMALSDAPFLKELTQLTQPADASYRQEKYQAKKEYENGLKFAQEEANIRKIRELESSMDYSDISDKEIAEIRRQIWDIKEGRVNAPIPQYIKEAITEGYMHSVNDINQRRKAAGIKDTKARVVPEGMAEEASKIEKNIKRQQEVLEKATEYNKASSSSPINKIESKIEPKKEVASPPVDISKEPEASIEQESETPVEKELSAVDELIAKWERLKQIQLDIKAGNGDIGELKAERSGLVKDLGTSWNISPDKIDKKIQALVKPEVDELAAKETKEEIIDKVTPTKPVKVSSEVSIADSEEWMESQQEAYSEQFSPMSDMPLQQNEKGIITGEQQHIVEQANQAAESNAKAQAESAKQSAQQAEEAAERAETAAESYQGKHQGEDTYIGKHEPQEEGKHQAKEETGEAVEAEATEELGEALENLAQAREEESKAAEKREGSAESLEQEASFLDKIKGKWGQTKGFMRDHQKGLEEIGSVLGTVSGMLDKTTLGGQQAAGAIGAIGGVLKVVPAIFNNIGQGFSAIPWMTVAMGVISIINGISMAIETPEEKLERLTQEAEKLNNEAKQAKADYKSLDSEIKKFEELKEKRYESAEATEEYQNAVDNLVENFPEMIAGFDAAGNVIIDTTNAEELLAEARKKSAQATFDAVKAELNVANQQKVTNTKKVKEQAQNLLDNLGERSGDLRHTLSNIANSDIDFNTEKGQDYLRELQQLYGEAKDRYSNNTDFSKLDETFNSLISAIQSQVSSIQSIKGYQKASIGAWQQTLEGYEYLDESAAAVALVTHAITKDFEAYGKAHNNQTFEINATNYQNIVRNASGHDPIEEMNNFWTNLSDTNQELFDKMFNDKEYYSLEDFEENFKDFSGFNNIYPILNNYYNDVSETVQNRLNNALAKSLGEVADASGNYETIDLSDSRLRRSDFWWEFAYQIQKNLTEVEGAYLNNILSQYNKFKDNGYTYRAENFGNAAIGLFEQINSLSGDAEKQIWKVIEENGINTLEGLNKLETVINNINSNLDPENQIDVNQFITQLKSTTNLNINLELQRLTSDLLENWEDTSKQLSSAMSGGVSLKEADGLIQKAKELGLEGFDLSKFTLVGDKLVLIDDYFTQYYDKLMEATTKTVSELEGKINSAKKINTEFLKTSGLSGIDSKYLEQIRITLESIGFEWENTSYWDKFGRLTQEGAAAIEEAITDTEETLVEYNRAARIAADQLLNANDRIHGRYRRTTKDEYLTQEELESIASQVKFDKSQIQDQAIKESLNNVYSSLLSDVLSKGFDNINLVDYQGLINDGAGIELSGSYRSFIEKYIKLTGKTVDEANDLIMQAIEKDSEKKSSDILKDLTFVNENTLELSQTQLKNLANIFDQNFDTILTKLGLSFNELTGTTLVSIADLVRLGIDLPNVEGYNTIIQDSVNTFFDSIVNLIKNGLSGSLTNVDFEKLQQWAGPELQLDFIQTENGIKLTEEALISLYSKLKSTYNLKSKLVFNELNKSLAETNEHYSTISAIESHILDLQQKINNADESVSGERISQYEQELELAQEILKVRSTTEESDSFKFMEKAIPSGLNNPLNYFSNMAQAWSSLTQAKQDGFMDYTAFYRIITEMGNLAEKSGEIVLGAGTVLQNSEQAEELLIRAGQALRVDVNGNLTIDFDALKQLGINFEAAGDDMAEGITKGIQTIAKSQIKMLDSMIAMLEAVAAMQDIGDIDLDSDNQISFAEIFDFENDGKVREEIQSWLAILDSAFDIKIGGQSLASKLFTALNPEQLSQFFTELYAIINNPEIDPATLPQQLRALVEKFFPNESIEIGEGALQKLGIDAETYKNGLYQKIIDAIKSGTTLSQAQKLSIVQQIKAQNQALGELLESILTQNSELSLGAALKIAAILTEEGTITKNENGTYSVNYDGFTGETSYATLDEARDALVEYLKTSGIVKDETIETTGTKITLDDKTTINGIVNATDGSTTYSYGNFTFIAPAGVSEDTVKTWFKGHIKSNVPSTIDGNDSTTTETSNATLKYDITYDQTKNTWTINGIDVGNCTDIEDALEKYKNKTESNTTDNTTSTPRKPKTITETININGTNFEVNTTGNKISVNGVELEDPTKLEDELLKASGAESLDDKVIGQITEIIEVATEYKHKDNQPDYGEVRTKLYGNEYKDEEYFNEMGIKVAESYTEGEFNSKLDTFSIEKGSKVESYIKYLQDLTNSGQALGNVDWTNLNTLAQLNFPEGDEFVTVLNSLVDKQKELRTDASDPINLNIKDDTNEQLTSLEERLEKLKAGISIPIAVDNEEASNAINKFQQDWDTWTPDPKTLTVTINKSNSENNSNPDTSDNTQGSSSQATGTMGLAKAKGTLLGELGPELVVSNGHYFVAGQNGPEMIDLADDAIVFNHLQTKSLLEKGVSTGRGQAITNERNAVSFATGNVQGIAMAGGVDSALATLKKLRAMWQSLLGLTAQDLAKKAGSGGGGGGDATAFLKDLERWYNWLQEIKKLEQEINYEESKRNAITSSYYRSGYDYYNSQKKSLEATKKEIDTYKDLFEEQKKYFNQRRKELNTQSAFSSLYTFDEDGQIKYHAQWEELAKLFGNDPTTGKTNYSVEEQYKWLIDNGYGYAMKYDSEGKEIDTSSEEGMKQAIEAFWAKIDSDKGEMEGLQESIEEYRKTILDKIQAYNELLQEMRDNQISLEQKIYDTIVDIRERAIEELQDTKDAIKDSNDKFIEGLNNALSKEREMYDSKETEDDLDKLRRQRDILVRSGGSAAEIASLEEQISDQEQSLYFDKQQQEIDAIQEASDKQIEKLETEISLQTEILEYQKKHGLLWAEVTDIMGKSPEEIARFIQENNSEYWNESPAKSGETLREILYSAEQWAGYRDGGNLQTDLKELYGLLSKLDKEDQEETPEEEPPASEPPSKEDEEGDKKWKVKYIVTGYDNKGQKVTYPGFGIGDTEEAAKSTAAKLAAEKMKNITGASVSYDPPVQFKTGGYDYNTGLAILHGTKQEPEAIFNASQTKILRNNILSNRPDSLVNLLKSYNNAYHGLQSSAYDSLSNNSNMTTFNGVELNVNVDSIATQEQARSAAHTMMDEMLRIASKSGANNGVGR